MKPSYILFSTLQTYIPIHRTWWTIIDIACLSSILLYILDDLMCCLTGYSVLFCLKLKFCNDFLHDRQNATGKLIDNNIDKGREWVPVGNPRKPMRFYK